MRTLIPALAGAVLLIGATSTPTIAQTHEAAFGLFGGASTFGDLTPADPTETELDEGWIAGVQLERWLAQSRVGLRFTVGYADRALSTHAQDRFRLVSGDLSLLIRLLRPEPYRAIAPYVALGGGAHLFSARNSPVVNAIFPDDPAISPMATIALGADLAASRTLGLRVEVADQLLLPSPFGDPDLERDFRPSHHVVLRAGLQLRALPGAPPLARVAATPPPTRTRTTTAPETSQADATNPADATTAAPDTDRLIATADSLRAIADARATEVQRLRDAVQRLERALEERRPAETDAAAAAPTATAAELAAAGYLTVQVGAYRTAAAARQAAERFRSTGVPTWISQTVQGGATYHRVRMGAIANRADAVRLAQRVRNDFGTDSWVAPIEASDPVPDDVVETTRAALPGP